MAETLREGVGVDSNFGASRHDGSAEQLLRLSQGLPVAAKLQRSLQYSSDDVTAGSTEIRVPTAKPAVSPGAVLAAAFPAAPTGRRSSTDLLPPLPAVGQAPTPPCRHQDTVTTRAAPQENAKRLKDCWPRSFRDRALYKGLSLLHS